MQVRTLQIKISEVGDKFEEMCDLVKEAISGIANTKQAVVQIETKTKTLHMSMQELKQIREELGLTQENLAYELNDCDPAWISRMETGRRNIPRHTAEAIKDLAEREKLRKTKGKK